MLVIPLAYFVVEANNARILNDVGKAILGLMGASRHRGGELPYNHFNKAGGCQDDSFP
jgi:hypothetical protein